MKKIQRKEDRKEHLLRSLDVKRLSLSIVGLLGILHLWDLLLVLLRSLGYMAVMDLLGQLLLLTGIQLCSRVPDQMVFFLFFSPHSACDVLSFFFL